MAVHHEQHAQTRSCSEFFGNILARLATMAVIRTPTGTMVPVGARGHWVRSEASELRLVLPAPFLKAAPTSPTPPTGKTDSTLAS
jgi:hypothetical protein